MDESEVDHSLPADLKFRPQKLKIGKAIVNFPRNYNNNTKKNYNTV